ncbi:4014_t:CDS:2, partial [Racocetra persica]
IENSVVDNGFGLYGACFTTSASALVLQTSSITRCVSYSGVASLTGVNMSWYGGMQFVEALHTIGEIVFYAILQKDLDKAKSSLSSSSSFSSSSLSPKISLTLGGAFALTVLSFVSTMVIVFIYWKTKSMPQEDQKNFYDTTQYNQNGGAV